MTLAQALPTGLVTLTLLAGAAVLAVGPAGAATAAPPAVSFGMDAASASAQAGAGAKPDYGTMWIGPWTLTSGWGGPDATMASLKSQGVTPAIHFYYWGDDISPSCVENGCWSSLHESWKDRAGWQRLGDQLGQHLNAKMGGARAVVFLESEFNKGGISSYEPFDGYLAGMANGLKAAYPNAVVVLGFGNWGAGDWGNFDRAAAASHMVGLQGMRGSTRDSASSYDNLYSATLAGVKTLRGLFNKPVMLTDIALSSYPEPAYAAEQGENLQRFFTGMPALRDSGVQAMVYRSWKDSPGMDTANYYGVAERHWGLVHADGSHKAAAKVWVDGVKAIRAGASTASPTSSPSPTASAAPTSGSGYSATFTPSAGSNEWWVEVKVAASSAPAKVEAQVNSGSWNTLSKTSHGSWAKSFYAAKGSTVTFRAWDPGGHAATQSFTWLSGSPVPAAPAPTFSATFTPKAVGNDWWVEAKVTSEQGIAKVEARLNYGAWTVLPKTSWGSHGDDLRAPNGTQVQFRATSTSGSTITSGTYTWT